MNKKFINRKPNCICDSCGIEFYCDTYKLRNCRSHCCSMECSLKLRNKKQNVKCLKCEKEFIKGNAECIKYPNHFCSHSCSASYNNTNKKYGTRRAKLEIYLEEQIKQNYPDLELICNQKSVIQSELDFFFPELKFAIELNGIVHYEPIYGKDKFDKIQNNDKRKAIACYEKGIELAIIDTSSCNYLSETAKLKFKTIVFDLLDRVKNRKLLGEGTIL